MECADRCYSQECILDYSLHPTECYCDVLCFEAKHGVSEAHYMFVAVTELQVSNSHPFSLAWLGGEPVFASSHGKKEGLLHQICNVFMNGIVCVARRATRKFAVQNLQKPMVFWSFFLDQSFQSFQRKRIEGKRRAFPLDVEGA